MDTVNLRSDSRSSLYAQAAVAGIIGGIVVDAFLAVITHTSPVALWQFIASTIVGQTAFTSPSYAIVGFIVHFIVSIVWAMLYTYAFGALGQLKNWILGAIVLGVAADAGMQLILAIKIGAPWGAGFMNGLLGHIVFFALPVALYMARAVRVETRSA